MKKIIILLFVLLLQIQNAFAVNVDEMISQMIITGFKGNSIKSKGFKEVLKQADNNEISGVIFFEDNIKNKEEFLKMTSAIKNSKAKLPLFISIDMEGGKIARMNENNGFETTKSAKEISTLTLEESYKENYRLAKMLKEANINLNFAPCVDLQLNEDSIIAKKERSYGKDPKTVAKYAKTFIDAHYQNGIITSIKHFPGHGSSTGDTHLGFVNGSDTYKDEEIVPYLELANINPMQTVMISHLYNNKIDDKYPASLSYKTIEQFLRIQADFDGVIVTDDLCMGAIAKNYDLEEIVTLAINAGENILLFSNRDNRNKKLVKNANLAIKRGLIDGNILPKNIVNSYEKITKLKAEL